MSKLIGILRDRKIYDDDPKLSRLMCEVEFVPVRGSSFSGMAKTRCDYCGRANERGKECASCGAPL